MPDDRQQQLPPGLTPLDSPGIGGPAASGSSLPPGLTPLETQPDFTRRPSWWDQTTDAIEKGWEQRGPGAIGKLAQAGAQKLRGVASDLDTSNLKDMAHGTFSKPTGVLRNQGSMYTNMAADALDLAGGLVASPKNAALTAAQATPLTRVPANAYIAASSAADLPEDFSGAMQGNPDALQKTLLRAAGVAGGVAGVGRDAAVGKAKLQNWAMEDPDVAALKAQGVEPNSKQASKALKDAQAVRPYVNSPKTQAELQSRTQASGPARTEIWDNYSKAIQQVGNNVVQGPDGPATVADLEAERLKLSAQNRAIKGKDPNALQEIKQAGRTPAQNLEREQAVIAAIDPELASTGLDPKLTRSTMGNVMGVSRRVSGRMGGLETAPSGLGRLAGTARVNVGSAGPQIYVPENIRGAVVEGAKDIIAGRGLFRQRPADVAVREGFRNPGPKPNLTPGPGSLYGATPIGPQASPQQLQSNNPPTPPAAQVGQPPPIGFPAQLPNTLWNPSQQGTPWGIPGQSVPSADVPGVEPTAVDLPDTLMTPGRPDVPIGQRGLTDAQMRGMPSFMRDAMSNPTPRPGEYSTPDVGPDRSPLPQPESDEGGASVPDATPPTDLTASPESQPSDQVLPEQITPDFVDQSVHPWQSEARVQAKQGKLQQGEDATIVARQNPDGTYSPVKGHQSPVAAAREGAPVNVVDAGPMTDGEKAAATAESHFFPQDDHAVPADLGKDAASERASLPDEIKAAPAMPAKEGPQSNVIQRGNQPEEEEGLLPEQLGIPEPNPQELADIQQQSGLPLGDQAAIQSRIRDRSQLNQDLARTARKKK